MQTPFQTTFHGKISDLSNAEILNNFKTTFEDSNCDSVEIMNDSRLFVENNYIKPNWNFWRGVGQAEVTITTNSVQVEKDIHYKIDYTLTVNFLLIFFALISSLFLAFSGKSRIETIIIILWFFLFCLIITVLSIISIFIRHRSEFRRIIENNKNVLGNYDWPSILNKKTDEELYKISLGDTQLPKAVSSIAKDILEKRNVKFENKESNKF
jgi:hypothetical protein